MSSDAVSCAPSLRRSHCPALSSAGLCLARFWEDYSVCLHSLGGLDSSVSGCRPRELQCLVREGLWVEPVRLEEGVRGEWGCRQSLPGLSLHWSSLPISPCLASAGEWPESRAPGVHGCCLEDHVLR